MSADLQKLVSSVVSIQDTYPLTTFFFPGKILLAQKFKSSEWLHPFLSIGDGGLGVGGILEREKRVVFFVKKKRENGKQNDMQDECLEGLQ